MLLCKEASLLYPYMDLLRLTLSELQDLGSNLKGTSGIREKLKCLASRGWGWATAFSQTER